MTSMESSQRPLLFKLSLGATRMEGSAKKKKGGQNPPYHGTISWVSRAKVMRGCLDIANGVSKEK